MDPWLQSTKDHERERAAASIAQVLKCLCMHLNLKVSCPSVAEEEGSKAILLLPISPPIYDSQTYDSSVLMHYSYIYPSPKIQAL